MADWRPIAEQVTKEKDPAKLAALIEQLCCALDGEQRTDQAAAFSRTTRDLDSSSGNSPQTPSLGRTGVYDIDPTRPIGDWKEAWEKAKERAGAILSDKAEQAESEPLQCRFHDLRLTAVTRLLEAGIPYPVVASMMGWSAATAIRMAKRYGHIGSKALRDAADVLGRVEIGPASLKKSPKSPEAENICMR